MNEHDIATAKARAEDVCNGFLHVRTQQARDVVWLAEALQAADRKIEALNRKIDEPRVSTPSLDVPDFLSGLFRGGRR